MADLFDPARGTWMLRAGITRRCALQRKKLRGGVVRVYRRHAARGTRAGRRHYPRPESRIHAYANGKYDSRTGIVRRHHSARRTITSRLRRCESGWCTRPLGQNEAALEKFRFAVEHYPLSYHSYLSLVALLDAGGTVSGGPRLGGLFRWGICSGHRRL